MATASQDSHTVDSAPDDADVAPFDAAATPGRNPRDTSHPTGEQQAAENAENEPAG